MTNLPTPENNDLEAMKHAVRAKDLRSPLDSLPDYVKDPKNYQKIEKALLETMVCPKSHSDPMEMTKCKKCTENMLVRRQMLKKLGFKHPSVYLAWKKIQTGIRKRTPLVDWEKGENIKITI